MNNLRKIETYIPLSNKEIKNIWIEINNLYNKYLKKYNIKLPSFNTCKAFQLIYLYKFKGCFVHKDVIYDFISNNIKFIKDKSPKKDQQVRHLASQNGFYITTKGEEIKGEKTPAGYHMLVTLKQPNPKYIYESAKRSMIFKAKDFDALKAAYNHCCATCGCKEGSLHKITNKPVVLTKGHMDPSKPLTLDNTIPQCEYCNQNAYKNNFIFNENGYVEAIYNSEVVFKSPEQIQKEIYLKLKEKFE